MAIPAAAVSGVLIDSDHVLDYYLLYVRKDRRRLFLVFHGWEYTLAGLTLALLVWQHPVLIAGVLGHLGHLVSDHVANRPYRLLAYSIIFRTYYGFHREQVFQEPPPTFSDALQESIPPWRLIEPMLAKLTT